MSAPGSWLAETTRTYLANAASRKDFRVQMRGSKPFWVFTLYVSCLCLIGLAVYWETLGREGLSIADAQSDLTGFFYNIMALLAGAICIVAPGLTGGAIVSEKQRLSLDLILTAPVEPKYLLVGKMISSYRYIWMLLILALPVVATSVVLGGATWTDVFGCFVLLSFHAMIFTSIALLISSVTAKPASAVIWSLLAVGGYVIASSILYGFSEIGGGMFMGGSSSHDSFVVAMNPFLPLQAINTTTLIGSTEVPNWIFGIVIALLLTRLFLLGAAVNLAPLDKRLSTNLRVTGLVYTMLLSLLVTYSLKTFMVPTMPSVPPKTDWALSGVAVAAIGWLLFAAPYFACYSNDASRRFRLNGRFSLRHTFDGTPAGSLPYVFLLVAASYIGVIVGFRLTGGNDVGRYFVQALAWPIGFIVLSWSIGQLLSASVRTLKTARVLTLVVLILPPFIFPLLMGLARLAPPWSQAEDIPTSGIWYLWPYAPFTDYDIFTHAWIWGSVMFVVGLAISIWARQVEKKRSLRVANA